MDISYFLIMFAFLATLIGIRGNTWDEQQHGLRKISITGWMVFFLACSAAVFSSVKEYRENVKKGEEERAQLFKRLDGLDSLATQSWYLQSMFKSIALDIEDRPELYELSLNQLKFMRDELSRTQNSYSSSLNRDERIALEQLMFLVTGTLHGLTMERSIVKVADLEKLVRYAQKSNILFCEPIKDKTPFCYLGENQ